MAKYLKKYLIVQDRVNIAPLPNQQSVQQILLQQHPVMKVMCLIKQYPAVYCVRRFKQIQKLIQSNFTNIQFTQQRLNSIKQKPSTQWKQSRVQQCLYKNSKGITKYFDIIGLFKSVHSISNYYPVSEHHQTYLFSFNLIRNQWLPKNDLLIIDIQTQNQKLSSYQISYQSKQLIQSNKTVISCQNNNQTFFTTQKFNIKINTKQFLHNKIKITFTGYLITSLWGLTNINFLPGCERFTIYNKLTGGCDFCDMGYFPINQRSSLISKNQLQRCQKCSFQCNHCMNQTFCYSCIKGYKLVAFKCVVDDDEYQRLLIEQTTNMQIKTCRVMNQSFFINTQSLKISTINMSNINNKPFNNGFMVFEFVYNTKFQLHSGRVEIKVNNNKVAQITQSNLTNKGFQACSVQSLQRYSIQKFSVFVGNVSSQVVNFSMALINSNSNNSSNNTTCKQQCRYGFTKLTFVYTQQKDVVVQTKQQQQLSIQKSSTTHSTITETVTTTTTEQYQNKIILQRQQQTNLSPITITTSTVNDNSSITTTQNPVVIVEVQKVVNNNHSSFLTSSPIVQQSQLTTIHMNNNVTLHQSNTVIINSTNNKQLSTQTATKQTTITTDIVNDIDQKQNSNTRSGQVTIAANNQFSINKTNNNRKQIEQSVEEQQSTKQSTDLIKATDHINNNDFNSNNYNDINSNNNNNDDIYINNNDNNTETNTSKTNTNTNIIENKQSSPELLDSQTQRVLAGFEQFFNSLVWVVFVIMFVAILTAKMYLIQQTLQLIQCVFMTVYIFTSYFPGSIINTISGLSRLENLNFLPQSLILALQNLLLNNLIQQSPLRLTLFHKDINFIRNIIPIFILLFLILIWFILIVIYDKKTRQQGDQHDQDGIYGDYIVENNNNVDQNFGVQNFIQWFHVQVVRKIARNKLDYWTQVLNIVYLSILFIVFKQFNNFKYPDHSHIGQVVNIILCLVTFLATVVLLIGSIYKSSKKYYKLQYSYFIKSFPAIYYKKIPKNCLPTKHHLFYNPFIKITKPILYCLLVALAGNHPISIFILMLIINVAQILFAWMHDIYQDSLYFKFLIVESTIFTVMLMILFIISLISGVVSTDGYLAFGYVFMSLAIVVIINGFIRSGYLIVDYVHKQMKREQKGAQSSRIV